MNHSHKIIAGLALLAVTALTPACGFHPDTTDAPSTSTMNQPAPSPQASPVPTADSDLDTDTGPTDEQLEELKKDIDSATEITDEFWKTHWSEYFTGTYTAPEVVGTYDGTDPTNAPTCNGEPLAADNAVYCTEGDYVAWDAGLMLRSLDVGNPWVYLVVAHEWGHAVVERLSGSLETEDYELQADCLAGATLYGAVQDGSMSLEPGTEKQIVDALNMSGDETPWTNSSDHGDSFQRIEAFDQGRTEGVFGCFPE